MLSLMFVSSVILVGLKQKYVCTHVETNLHFICWNHGEIKVLLTVTLLNMLRPLNDQNSFWPHIAVLTFC